MAIYMKLANHQQGNSSAQYYQGWSTLSSLHFALHQPYQRASGRKLNRLGTIPQFSAATISKTVDGISNQLFELACSGKALPEVTIEISTLDASNKPYCKYILYDVVVSHLDHNATSYGLPQELIELNFTKIETHYIGRDQRNQPTAPNITGYDLMQAKAL